MNSSTTVLVLSILFFGSDSYAVDCVPQKSKAVIAGVCSKLKNIQKSEIETKLGIAAGEMVYDDCGLSAAIVYAIERPYALIFHPLRPFIKEKKIEFASVPRLESENPFLKLAKLLETKDSVELRGYETALGFYRYKRDYWASRCATKDGVKVVVAAAQTRISEKQYVGSNLSAIDYQILESAELRRLVRPNLSPADQKKYFLTLSSKIIAGAIPVVAKALRMNEKTISVVLSGRVNEEDHYQRFLAAIEETPRSKFAIIGFFQSDIEHVLFLFSGRR